ncbi:MAG: hypothetical protein C0599_13810 [Salinivirgaceae bacterium]|nr:MAG: hypothetical protein C0599_13810 [Salinivirgaceae bacterium]
MCLSGSQQITVTEPDAIIFETTTTPASGGGASDGSIEVINVAGGTAPYEYSNNGGMTWQASSIFSGLTAGTYDIQVRDVNLCLSDISSVTVTEPVGFSVSFTITDAATGLPIEGADITAGGVSLTTNVNGFAGIDLPDGKHSFSISYTSKYSATGYIYVDEAPVTVEAALTPMPLIAYDLDLGNITCNGGNDGSISFIDVTGGSNSGFKYSIDDGLNWQSTADFSNLNAGTYYVQVKDDSGNYSVNTSVTITDAEMINFSALVEANVSCFGGNDGQIEVSNVSGGTSPYQYSVDGGANWQSESVLTNLPVGAYDVLVRDVNLCLSSGEELTISEPNELTFDANVASNASCSGCNDGSIVVSNITGGYGPYSYSIDGGNNWQPSVYFLNLTAGTYEIMARDANLCISPPSEVTVLEPGEISFDIQINQQLSCENSSDGEIEIINMSGGYAPYSYSNDGGSTWQSNPVFSNLSADTFAFKVKDAAAFQSSSQDFTLYAPDPIHFSTNITHVTYYTGSNGQIEVIDIVNGVGPYEYSIDDGISWQASTTFANLSAGIYSVVVRDANLCMSQPSDIEVEQPPIGGYLVTFSVIDVDNSQAIDGAEVNVGSHTLVTDASGIATVNLSNGVYNYTVTRAGYQIKPGSVTVNGPDIIKEVALSPANPLSFNIAFEDISCNGETDGAIEFTYVSGGLGAGYEYSIDAGATWQSSDIFSGLPASTYTAVIKDGSGTLSDPETVTIIEPDAILFDVNTTDVNAFGGSDGSIEVINVTGGTGSFEYSIDEGVLWQASQTFAGLMAGTYMVQVRDANLCVSSVSEEIIDQPAPSTYTITFNVIDDISLNAIESASISINGNTITTNSNGEATIELSDGTYEYTLTHSVYDTIESFVTVASQNLTETVEMIMTSYTVTFYAVYAVKDGIEGVQISINDTLLITDFNGYAFIDLTPGAYDYEVSYEFEEPFSASLSVVSEDIEEYIVFGGGVGESLLNQINVYPNPSRGVINIELEGVYTVSLINSIGNVILTKRMEALGLIEVDKYADGLYLLRIDQNGYTITKPVIIKK